MGDKERADMVELIAPPVIIPVHYADYKVFRFTPSNFLDEVRRRELPWRFGR
jgi:L-ascorbate metabolism protein UlaG (beta-lactamase superfamily)